MAKRSNSGQTQRRHVFVEAIEDIGKEADRWDDEEPLTADSEFTVSYGVSETDRSTMLAVIQSVSKRRLSFKDGEAEAEACRPRASAGINQHDLPKGKVQPCQTPSQAGNHRTARMRL